MPPASILLNSQRNLCSVMIAGPVVLKWDMEPFENLTLDLRMQILNIWIILNLSNILIPLAGTSKVVPIVFSLALHISHYWIKEMPLK